MEKQNTKQLILEAALDLFSVKGFEATSISQIADAVGIRKASLYSHFSSKQDILDTLVNQIFNEHQKHSMFSTTDFDDKGIVELLMKENGEYEFAQQIKDQIRFLVHDPHVSKARKMLVIEQFQNPELSKIQSSKNYNEVMKYHICFFEYLLNHNMLIECDPLIVAAQFCLPITLWLNVCDREPEREEEIMGLIEKHVVQIFKIYGKKEA